MIFSDILSHSYTIHPEIMYTCCEKIKNEILVVYVYTFIYYFNAFKILSHF